MGNTGFAGDSFGRLGFALSESGIPFLAHADSSTGKSVAVLQFNGANWVQVGSPGFTPAVNDLSFTIDSETPYIACQYPKNTLNDVENLTVMRYRDAQWQLVGPVDIIPGHYPLNLNIVVEDDVPYLGFQHNGFGGGATAMKYTETTSTDDLVSGNARLSIYPNPAKREAITFDLHTEVITNALLRVYDLAGRRFYEQQIFLENGKAAAAVQLADWPAGFYVAKLTLPDNQTVSAKLLITR